MKTFLVLYLPVIHQGYLNLFEKYSKEADGLLILGESLVEECKFLEREIRAISPAMAKKIAEAIGLFKKVEILERPSVEILKGCGVITAQEGITRRFAEKYLTANQVVFDSSFLRWDETSIVSRTDTKYDRESKNPFDVQMMRLAEKESRKSPDWWRQVGAAAVRNGNVIATAFNKDPVSEYRSYALGNIRDFVRAGQKSELTPTVHAEKVLAARNNLRGADIYVTVFPCVDCAGVLAEADIKRCFFASGNAYLGAERILQANGVELIFVNLKK